MQVLRISGKAKQVFTILSLMVLKQGNKTLGELYEGFSKTI